MGAPTIASVSLAVVQDPTVPDDRPSLVLTTDDVTLDPDAPGATFSITTNWGLGRDSNGALIRVGLILHHVAHALLSEQGVRIDLTPAGGPS